MLVTSTTAARSLRRAVGYSVLDSDIECFVVFVRVVQRALAF